MIVVGSCYFLLTLVIPYDPNIDFVFPLIHLYSSHGTTYSCHHSQPCGWEESMHGALKGFTDGPGGNKVGGRVD